MKYPKINKQPTRTVQIPSLSGGMNLRDSLNLCNDNQLTDSLNMWFRDGVLKTRPGRLSVAEHISASTPSSSGSIQWKERENKNKCHKDITKIINGKHYVLVSYLEISKVTESYTDEDGSLITTNRNYSRLSFFWVTDDGYEPDLHSNIGMEIELEDRIENYFVTVTPKGMYLFLKTEVVSEESALIPSTFKIYKFDTNSNVWNEISRQIVEYNESQKKWVKNEEIYAPILSTHGFYQKDNLPNGENYEGKNLITPYYRMIYSTVNKSLLTDDNDTHPMEYGLLSGFDKDSSAQYIIMAEYINADGTKYTHTAFKNTEFSDEYYEWDVQGNNRVTQSDGLSMAISAKGVLRFEKLVSGNYITASVSKKDFVEDNLTITAVLFDDKDEFEKINKVFSMTQAEWFGGASEGINGGTRLFLGGNIEEKEQSLIIWSGLNNPLYFSENNYSYVGNSMSAVTAFGKQSDMLVIFKENELYYTKYTQNTNITAEDLINQSVVDYQASNVYFPLVQIHSGIGCDCPNTVQLCRNRLVWADSRGYVYTLTNNNQFSERNIFCVSDMVHNKLSTETDLRAAYSADYGDYYMLFCGNKVYLMDYNSYGYQYISSFSKAEDANIRIPWYYWEVNGSNNSLYISVDKKLLCFNFEYTTDNRRIELYVFDSETDNGQPIKSMAQTKFFDFGLINYKKNIDNVTVSFGNNGGTPIMLQYLTERGTDAQTVTVTDDETNIRNAGYITTCILRPAIKSIERFGLRFNCDGNMAIQGLNISYRALGGIK